MDKLKELRKRQKELNAELDKVVQDIYKELYKLKVGDLLCNDSTYYKILDVNGIYGNVLTYSWENNFPYIDVSYSNLTQLNYDKVEDDNGTLTKIINFLNETDNRN